MEFKIPGYLTERFVPNLEAVRLLELFLISAVSSVLIIRAYLILTGFPQIGGGDLHIAHMLWGGLLMLASIVVLLSYINASSKAVAAVLGGIGFGTFIDELGKFITSDNDYFYQPTIALIYIIFILLYLMMRAIASHTQHSSKTYTSNAVEGLKELIILDLDTREKKKALDCLANSDANDPIVKLLKNLLMRTKPKPIKQNILARYTNKSLNWYKTTVRRRMVSKILLLFFIVSTLINLMLIGVIVYERVILSVSDVGYIISIVIVGVYVIFGMYHYLRKNRLSAFESLEKASLVSIFLSQFFRFLQDELSAITWLFVYITIYIILEQAIKAEQIALIKK